MAVFHIAFDLVMERVDPSRNYDTLFSELQIMEHYKLSRNSWFVATDDLEAETGRNLRDSLMRYLHDNDPIFVIPIDRWFANAPKHSMRWLADHLPIKTKDDTIE